MLALMAAGYSNQNIAAELGISLSTVKTHVESVLKAMGAENRTEAAALARNEELVDGAADGGFERRPAIAVLRFESAPADEHWSAGLVDDLITFFCQ